MTYPQSIQHHNSVLLVFMLSLLCGLSACALAEHRDTRGAVTSGFHETAFQGKHFFLKGWLKPGDAHARNVLHVYIEGDGRAWQSRTVVSKDPTPTAAIGLRLARAHPGREAVYYLARPGQYLSPAQRADCDPIYWTHARFSNEVVTDMNAAVDKAKRVTGAENVALYGYSGGGAIAVLIAARRGDVAFLATVAGNLDHSFWTSLHGVSPLSQSLNPIDVADVVRDIPQLHIAGGKDEIVPVSVVQRFRNAIEGGHGTVLVIPGMRHEGAWERLWAKELLQIPPQ